MEDTIRTQQQNKALHAYLRDVANEFNENGHSVQEIITLPIQFTPDIVKDCMFRRYIFALLGKNHTHELTQKEFHLAMTKFQEYMSRRYYLTSTIGDLDGFR